MSRRLMIVSVCLWASTLLLTRLSAVEAVPDRAPLATFPLNIEGWQNSAAIPLENGILSVLRVDDYLNRIYLRGSAFLGFYVGYYESQRQGDTIHSPLNCLPGAGWQPVTHDLARFDAASSSDGGDARTLTVNRFTIEKGLDRQVVLYWYQFHGRVVASDYTSRMLMVFDAVRLNRTDGALVRIIVPLQRSDPRAETDAYRAAVEFARAAFPLLSRYLPA